MRAIRLGILHLLAVAFAVWAANSLDARAGDLEAIIAAAISGQESNPAIQMLAGEWFLATSLLDLPAMLLLMALLSGGLPLAFAGLVIDRARPYVPRLVAAGQPAYYGCLVFQVTSMLVSAFWLIPVVLSTIWHGFDSASLLTHYLSAQILAGFLVLPTWRRLSMHEGRRMILAARA
jgi:hypothetical protein